MSDFACACLGSGNSNSPVEVGIIVAVKQRTEPVGSKEFQDSHLLLGRLFEDPQRHPHWSPGVVVPVTDILLVCKASHL